MLHESVVYCLLNSEGQSEGGTKTVRKINRKIKYAIEEILYNKTD